MLFQRKGALFSGRVIWGKLVNFTSKNTNISKKVLTFLPERVDAFPLDPSPTLWAYPPQTFLNSSRLKDAFNCPPLEIVHTHTHSVKTSTNIFNYVHTDKFIKIARSLATSGRGSPRNQIDQLWKIEKMPLDAWKRPTSVGFCDSNHQKNLKHLFSRPAGEIWDHVCLPLPMRFASLRSWR